jgi:replicative DNA helicase Mcm
LEKVILPEDRDKLSFIKNFAFGDIGFEKIASINTVENTDQKWTYDVTIEPNHTFISQNMVLHNTISINKANISATLRAETTVLAAANPKFGRFDPYELIPKQIDLPSTLINRFDLIFPIRDIPNKAKDEKTADFILQLHQKASGGEADLTTGVLKKYIAYARQNINPNLTDQALEEIKEYYVKMRSSGEGDEGFKAIPISARQLEALIRLSEASARARLSDKVSKADARRAIDLVHFCLSQIGVDPETGKLDIDRLTTGITASQRSSISVVKEIIHELEQQIGKQIPVDDILMKAKEKGLDQEKVEEVLDKLKKSGDIFNPQAKFITRI